MRPEAGVTKRVHHGIKSTYTQQLNSIWSRQCGLCSTNRDYYVLTSCWILMIEKTPSCTLSQKFGSLVRNLSFLWPFDEMVDWFVQTLKHLKYTASGWSDLVFREINSRNDKLFSRFHGFYCKVTCKLHELSQTQNMKLLKSLPKA